MDAYLAYISASLYHVVMKVFKLITYYEKKAFVTALVWFYAMAIF